ETAAMADAWATALLVAGEEAGMAIAERENIAALFITRTANKSALEFESVASPAFAQLRPTQED
ncbi:MAG: FAD:protein FMN transferase, partial [Pseudomonadota bacterium]